MRINMSKEIRKSPFTVLSCFLLSINHEGIEGIKAKIKNKNNDYMVDVIMTVNGSNVPLRKVIQNFENRIEGSVKRRAKELFGKKFDTLISDKISSVSDLADDLRDRLKKEIDKYLEDWEK